MAARALLAFLITGLALAAVPLSDGGGPTYVEGAVAGTWTPEGSPYILVGNATVLTGETLTISAGVVVLADRWVRLGVIGGLLVDGTSDAPVRFAANTSLPSDAGYWEGIHAANFRELTMNHAVIQDAVAALTISGGTATVAASSLTGNFRGIAVQDGAAIVTETAISENSEAGVFLRTAALTMRGGLLSGNRMGMDLGGAQALVENTTFLGPTFADVSVDIASLVKLRMCVREAPLKFVDSLSRIEIEGLLAVSVTDAFGTAHEGATVHVEDNANGTASVTTATNHEGRVPGLVVMEQRLMMAGAVDFNPFTVTATVPGAQRSEAVFVHRAADVSLTIPLDLTPPTPVVTRFITANEDAPVLFDATLSTDNDPDLAAHGTFRWAFPEIGLELTGITATHTFATPGLVQGVLIVTDGAGNEGVLTFAVRVVDRTPPTITNLVTPPSGGVERSLHFEAAATDNDPEGLPTITWEFTHGSTTVTRNGASVDLAFSQAGSWTVVVTATDRSGNEVSMERTIEIVAPPPPSPWPWIAAGGALLAAGLGLATERGKVGFLTLLLPLYTRIKDDEVLDQFTRGQIYGYIRVHPGDTYTDIKRNLQLNNGTLTYHLDVLERQQLIRSAVRGARKMFYPMDVTVPENGGGVHEIQQRLLKGITEAPGIAVPALAASLGIS
ncbi:MAG TPA: PKD domain-containing protein, partial [Thermoplasmata archaeon]|nr:PKD domain-containing protein [Thermoplasmata archaeon]